MSDVWTEEDDVRTMIKITVPVEAGNAAIRDGRLQKLIGETLERLKPEAAYFLAERGVRTAMLVIDLKDSADLPTISEPFFMGVNAAVEAMPVMNAEDLKKGLSRMPQTV